MARTAGTPDRQTCKPRSKKAAKQEIQGREGINTATVAYQTELDKTKTKLKDLGSESIKLQKEYDTLLKLATGFAKAAGDAFVKDQNLIYVCEEGVCQLTVESISEAKNLLK